MMGNRLKIIGSYRNGTSFLCTLIHVVMRLSNCEEHIKQHSARVVDLRRLVHINVSSTLILKHESTAT